MFLDSWPGQMRTVYGDHKRFVETYFSDYPGIYFAGDGCRRDEDGFYWITGRVDDVINVSGHRMGTAEVESALVAHDAVSEAAVVGFPHDIKGQGIYAYVTLMAGRCLEDLKVELVNGSEKKSGPLPRPTIFSGRQGYQDSLRQNHETYFAQNCRERSGNLGEHPLLPILRSLMIFE